MADQANLAECAFRSERFIWLISSGREPLSQIAANQQMRELIAVPIDGGNAEPGMQKTGRECG
jgi:hypothetical protein